ncbi:ALF repeat-containing protein [Nonomuraea sp. SBT364]|uniref:ALF repeat-containing protein n=1 Tax=Nonomuraea sp. SBT364 TaxID=1580530 RepID=UPI0018CD19D6|nr:ALF repeat-containing protein [Nonomuraea sp. SBT364]
MNGSARPFAVRRQATIAVFEVLVLLGSLLRATPAHAEAPVVPDRSHVVSAWQEGGPLVRAAAEAALLGSDEQVSAFLAEGWRRAQRLDERDQLASVISEGGPALRAKAQAALDADAAGDQSAISAFLESGWQGPSDIDARVSVNQLMSAGGEEVKQAAQAVLDSGDSAKLREFLEAGWQTQWNSDQRLRINQAIATGGPNVRAAGQQALDAETPEALEAFLSYGWAVASARDDETATLEDLLGQAEAAGKVAAQETANATGEADRAEDAAAAARKSAAEAAAATEAARDNMAEAKAQAKRAAKAAQKAAAAAQVAVQAAAAANRAARAAATAAARAAQMASKANQKAAEAYRAAAEASVDANRASVARQAAQAANAIAQETREIAINADSAAKALENGQKAIDSATSAAEHALAAAVANDEAVRYANAAGAEAQDAVAAAARARANAERAVRAARAAEKYLRVAIDAAYKARDAANRAAANAQAAAAAALDAAEHAGEAAEAAKRATEHANAAIDAAQQALETVNQAAAVYEAARTADAERLAVARDEGLETARAANAEYEAQQRIADWDVDQAAKRDAETNRLITVAVNPATERAAAVAAARKVALNLAGGQGAWTKEAALSALGSADDLVLDFVRTGLSRAVAQDNRLAVTNLGVTENAALATAAKNALAGSDQTVATFLRTQNYPGRYSADRLKVNQILTTAKAAGDVVLAERAQQALDADTLQALRDFLDTGQYTAAVTGERVLVNQILADPDSGPELKAAAQIALDGPAPGLRQFLDTGQHTAAERDHESAIHLAVTAGLLKRINEVAERALEDALEAQSVAARARDDAGQAASYAQQAIESAKRADGYAQQAGDYAGQAAASATRAATAVKTAREAATKARASARSAVRSATWAITSHQKAVDAANRATKAARMAYRDAIIAGHDAEVAVEAARKSSDALMYAAGVKIAECHFQYTSDQYTRLEDAYSEEGEYYKNCVYNILGSPEDLATRAYANSAFCDLYPQDSQDYENCVNSVLDPAFEGTQQLALTLQALRYGGAWIGIGFAPAIIGCAVTLVCGAALTITEVGLEIYRLANGDQSLSRTLLNIGTIALQELVFYGIGKIISVGFRALKNAFTAARTSSSALSEIRIGLIRNRHQLVLAEVRAMLVGEYSSVKNTAYFWSGRTEIEPDKYRYAGPDEAGELARNNDGTTLERLMDSRGIPQASGRPGDWDPAEMPWDEIQQQVNDAWDRISLAYARGASGEVKVILGRDVREQSVWMRQECKELLRNPNVTKITAIDLTTKTPRVITDESQCMPVNAPMAALAA